MPPNRSQKIKTSRRRPLTAPMRFRSPIQGGKRTIRDLRSLTPKLIEHIIPLYEGPQRQGGYHHGKHPRDVMKKAFSLIARAEKYGIKIDRNAVIHAVIGHDLLFHMDAVALGFPSKEHLAADYTYKFLIKMGAGKIHALKVARIILATHTLAEPRTPEEIIMRAGDVGNLASSYKEFSQNTRNLYRESQLLSRTTESFVHFARRSLQFLPMYVWRMLSLTPHAYTPRGSSAWHEKAIRNCIELFSEINGGRNRIRVIAQMGVPPHPKRLTLKPNEFLVAVEPNPQLLERGLARWRKQQEPGRISNPAFFVPGTPEITPLEAQSVDAVHVPRAIALSPRVQKEIRRILRKNGKVVET